LLTPRALSFQVSAAASASAADAPVAPSPLQQTPPPLGAPRAGAAAALPRAGAPTPLRTAQAVLTGALPCATHARARAHTHRSPKTLAADD
jgi:hypothetical protein